MNKIELIYNKLKNIYELKLTTTDKLDDGFTIDVPVIVGESKKGTFWLYQEEHEENIFVFSIRYNNGERTHTHPYMIDDAIQTIKEFME